MKPWECGSSQNNFKLNKTDSKSKSLVDVISNKSQGFVTDSRECIQKSYKIMKPNCQMTGKEKWTFYRFNCDSDEDFELPNLGPDTSGSEISDIDETPLLYTDSYNVDSSFDDDIQRSDSSSCQTKKLNNSDEEILEKASKNDTFYDQIRKKLRGFNNDNVSQCTNVVPDVNNAEELCTENSCSTELYLKGNQDSSSFAKNIPFDAGNININVSSHIYKQPILDLGMNNASEIPVKVCQVHIKTNQEGQTTDCLSQLKQPDSYACGSSCSHITTQKSQYEGDSDNLSEQKIKHNSNHLCENTASGVLQSESMGQLLSQKTNNIEQFSQMSQLKKVVAICDKDCGSVKQSDCVYSSNNTHVYSNSNNNNSLFCNIDYPGKKLKCDYVRHRSDINDSDESSNVSTNHLYVADQNMYSSHSDSSHKQRNIFYEEASASPILLRNIGPMNYSGQTCGLTSVLSRRSGSDYAPTKSCRRSMSMDFSNASIHAGTKTTAKSPSVDYQPAVSNAVIDPIDSSNRTESMPLKTRSKVKDHSTENATILRPNLQGNYFVATSDREGEETEIQPSSCNTYDSNISDCDSENQDTDNVKVSRHDLTNKNIICDLYDKNSIVEAGLILGNKCSDMSDCDSSKSGYSTEESGLMSRPLPFQIEKQNSEILDKSGFLKNEILDSLTCSKLSKSYDSVSEQNSRYSSTRKDFNVKDNSSITEECVSGFSDSDCCSDSIVKNSCNNLDKINPNKSVDEVSQVSGQNSVSSWKMNKRIESGKHQASLDLKHIQMTENNQVIDNKSTGYLEVSKGKEYNKDQEQLKIDSAENCEVDWEIPLSPSLQKDSSNNFTAENIKQLSASDNKHLQKEGIFEITKYVGDKCKCYHEENVFKREVVKHKRKRQEEKESKKRRNKGNRYFRKKSLRLKCKVCGKVKSHFNKTKSGGTKLERSGRDWIATNPNFQSSCTTAKKLKCHICNASFKTIGRLKYHKLIHLGEKKYICKICCESFIDKISLYNHLTCHHSKKLYFCGQCGQSYKHLKSLKSHFALEHVEKRSLTCMFCNIDFNLKKLLDIHVQELHKSETGTECVHCGKTFLLKQNFIEHVKEHCRKYYLCDKCASKFIFKRNLINHEKCIHQPSEGFYDYLPGNKNSRLCSNESRLVNFEKRFSSSVDKDDLLMKDNHKFEAESESLSSLTNIVTKLKSKAFQVVCTVKAETFDEFDIVTDNKKNFDCNNIKKMQDYNSFYLKNSSIDKETKVVLLSRKDLKETPENKNKILAVENDSSSIDKENKVVLLSRKDLKETPENKNKVLAVENDSSSIDKENKVVLLSRKDLKETPENKSKVLAVENDSSSIDKENKVVLLSRKDLKETPENKNKVLAIENDSSSIDKENKVVLLSRKDLKETPENKNKVLAVENDSSSIDKENKVVLLSRKDLKETPENKNKILAVENDSSSIDEENKVVLLSRKDLKETPENKNKVLAIENDSSSIDKENKVVLLSRKDLKETPENKNKVLAVENDSSSIDKENKVVLLSRKDLKETPENKNKVLAVENDSSVVMTFKAATSNVALESNISRKKFDCTIKLKGMSQKCKTINVNYGRKKKKFRKCSFCGKKFKHTGFLNVHLRIHSGERPYKCHICGKGFIIRQTLDQHVRIHSGEMPYSCNKCNKVFSTTKQLTSHMTTHSHKYSIKCNYCYKTCKGYDAFKYHHLIHTGEKGFLCSYCEKTFTSQFILVQHKETHHKDKPFQCIECNSCFSLRTSLRSHFINNHTQEKLYTCSFCSYICKSKLDYHQHLKRHSSQNLHECIECGKKFVQKRCLVKHMKVHLINSDEPKHYKCDRCSAYFLFDKNLSIHKKALHIETVQKSYETNIGDKRNEDNVCEKNPNMNECNKLMQSESNSVNIFINENNKGMAKEIKEVLKFAVNGSVSKLNQQIRSAVKVEKPYICSVCGKCFKKREYLNKHYRIHAGLKRYRKHTAKVTPFKCTDCGRCFRFSSNLKTHRFLHTGEKKHKCEKCDRIFVYKSFLNKHMKWHNGVKPHLCNTCGKSLSSLQELISHKYSHTNNRPHRCNYCQKRFKQKEYLKKHLKLHESNNKLYPYCKKKSYSTEPKSFSTSQKGNILSGNKAVLKCKTDSKYTSGNEKEVIGVQNEPPADGSCDSAVLSVSTQNIDAVIIRNSNIKIVDCSVVLRDITQLKTSSVKNMKKNKQWKTCSFCGKKFNQIGHLNVHLRIHTGERPYKCQVCDKGFTIRQTLEQHTRIHTGEMPYSCKTCKKVFRTTTLLEAHRATHSKKRPIKCEYCPKTYKDTNGLKYHLLVHSGEKKFHCTYCDKSFISKSTLIIHKQSHQVDKPFQCIECSTFFKLKSSLRSHFISCHKEERPYKCCLCDYQCKLKSNLDRHLKTHSSEKLHECIECGKKFVHKRSLVKHMKVHLITSCEPKHYKCDKCSDCFLFEKNMLIHKKALHEESLDKAYIVNNCANLNVSKEKQSSGQDNKFIPTRMDCADIDVHEKQAIHVEIRQQNLVSSSDDTSVSTLNQQNKTEVQDEKHHVCSVCGKSFKRWDHLKVHYRMHTGIKPFKCMECGKTFAHEQSLQLHTSIHTGEKPYRCIKCGKTFRLKSTLRAHGLSHEKKKPFKCDDCGKYFKSPYCLKIHQMIHTGEMKHKCKQCDRKFVYQFALNRHMHWHNGVKPHSCNTCGKSFSSSTELRRHKYCHTDERPHVCKYCQKKFKQKPHLAMHLKLHEGNIKSIKLYECLECGNKFNSMYTLKMHTRRHTGEKPHVCPECKTPFMFRYNLKTHIRSVHLKEPMKKKLCPICNKFFLNMIRHLRTHTKEKPFACNHCEYRSAGKSELVCHIRIHTGEKPYSCLKCDYKCRDKSTLIKHNRFHTGEKRFVCRFEGCNDRFTVGSDRTLHEKRHVNLQCPFCPEIFNMPKKLAVHLKVHRSEKPYKCSICSKGFGNTSVLKIHLRETHANGKLFECEKCEMKFKTKRSYKIHYDRKHSENQPCKNVLCTVDGCNLKFYVKSQLLKHMRTTHSNERPYPCKSCEKSFKDLIGLKLHMRTHSGHKPYECKFCKKTFTQASNLKTHLVIHSDEKKFKCNECELCFKLKYSLQSHIKTAHTVRKKLECDICNKLFSSKGTLRSHKKKHQDRPVLNCLQCDKTFLSTDGLTVHMRSHTGERPFACTFAGCTKAFTARNILKAHMVVHTGERNFECPDCGKRFTQNSHMRTHQKRVHLGIKRRPSEKEKSKKFTCSECNKVFSRLNGLQYHMKIHTGEKPFSCDYCEMKFRVDSQRQNHIRTVHTKEKRYKCECCDACFVRRDYLNIHILDEHAEDGKRPFPCKKEGCEREFFLESELKRHMNYYHPDK